MPAPDDEVHGEKGARVKPAPDAEDPLTRLDHLVGAAPEPENTVLTDDARLVRWAGPSFLLFSLILLPWIGYIAVSLPTRQLSPNYDIAWAGLRRLPARRAGQHGLLRAAPVEVPVHRGRGDRHPARRGRVVRLHDDPGRPALAVVRAVRAGRAAAGRPVPVAQLPHAPDRRAPDPAPAPAAAAAAPGSRRRSRVP